MARSRNLPPPSTPQFRRAALGITAIVLLVVALTLTLLPLEGSGWLQCRAIAWRLAAVFGLWWAAYPELRRIPRWLWLAVPVTLLILVIRPRYVLLVIPLVILLALLRPRRR